MSVYCSDDRNYFVVYILFSLTDERLEDRDGDKSADILFDLYKKAIINNSRYIVMLTLLVWNIWPVNTDIYHN